MIAYFHIMRPPSTYVQVRGAVLAYGLLGFVVLVMTVLMTKAIPYPSVFLVLFVAGLTFLFRNIVIVFNYNRQVMEQALADSARQLLLPPPQWTYSDILVNFERGTLEMSLYCPLPAVAVVLYTDQGNSKKIELFKSLLAKHFYRAIPRILIHT